MQNLLVYQSLWAMERRRPDGLEWSLDEKLAMIRDAGFDGAGVRFFDLDYATQVTEFLRANKMSWQAPVLPQDSRRSEVDPPPRRKTRRRPRQFAARRQALPARGLHSLHRGLADSGARCRHCAAYRDP